MSMPRNGLGMSQSCSCTPNIRSKHRCDYERQTNIQENHLDETNQARTELKAPRELDLALTSSYSSSETSSLTRRCQHERARKDLALVSGKHYNSSKIKLRYSKIRGKQQHAYKSTRKSHQRTGRARTLGDLHFNQKTHQHADLHHETHFNSHRKISDSRSTLRPRDLSNESKINVEIKTDYIKSNSYMISSKAQHTPRAPERNYKKKKRWIEVFLSNLSFKVEISGSLTFDENISQRSCSKNAKFIDTAKGNKRIPGILPQCESSKRISNQLCYCSKDFSFSTAFINNPVSRKCACEEQHLRAEKKSIYTHRATSDYPQHDISVADPNLQSGIGKEVKYGNEMQIFYVFNKPFKYPAVPNIALECCALCQTDPIKSTTGVLNRLYHKFLEGSKDTPPAIGGGENMPQDPAERCANPSTHCQADNKKLSQINMQARGSKNKKKLKFKSKVPRGKVSVECECGDSNKFLEGSKKARPAIGGGENMPQDPAERCANPSTHCQADNKKLSQINRQSRGSKNKKKFKLKSKVPKGKVSVECECGDSNILSPIGMPSYIDNLRVYIENFKSFFHTVIEPVDCDCVSDKLSQINIKSPKPPCTCARDNFKRFFHTVIEPVDCSCVSNKLSQINMKSPKPPCTCAETGTQSRRDNFKRFFHTVIEPVDCNCVSNKLSQINMKSPKPPCTCAETGTQSRRESFKRFFHTVIEPVVGKCVCNKLSQIYMEPPELSYPAGTQSRNYNDSYQRAGRESFYRDIGTSGFPKDTNYISNPESQQISMEDMEYENNDNVCCVSEKPATSNKGVGSNGGCNMKCYYNTPQETLKRTNSSTFCCFDKTQNEGGVLKRLCLTLLKPKATQANHKSVLCQLGSTNNDIDIFENINQFAPKYINSCTVCHIEGAKNNGAIDKFFHFVLETKRIMPHGAQKSRKNRGTFCQKRGIICEDNFIKRLFQTLLEPNHQIDPSETVLTEAKTQSRKSGRKLQISGKDKLKQKKPSKTVLTEAKTQSRKYGRKQKIVGKDKLKQKKTSKTVLTEAKTQSSKYGRKQQIAGKDKLKQKKPSKTVLIEAKTQSRKYGRKQQIAGKEIFRKNRGTSGVPKQKSKKIKKEEEPVYEVIDENEEEAFVEPKCTFTNKEIGIGTNCNFTLGWFKDRLAYGEPKPPDAINDTKIAIEQWNEAPLKRVKKKSTKIGASLKTNSKFNFFCTHTGTQSRKYRKRDLRAGRETFYKERQTSCIPKCIKPPIDNNNNVIVNQPLQPPAPDRKALRLGSDCSFCFEFYKDVPPENPENIILKADESQRNKSILSKFSRQRRGIPGKSDAFTGTEVISGEDEQSKKQEPEVISTKNPPNVPKDKDKSEQEECRCERKKKKSVKPSQVTDQPLHMGSRVKFNFNFFKSISPPARSNHIIVDDIKEKCTCGVLTDESDISLSRQGVQENKRVDSVSSECDPRICEISKPNEVDPSTPNAGDLSPADFIKSTKKCLLQFMSRKNFKRLIIGEKKPEVKKQLPMFMSRKKPELVCKAKCKKMGEEPVDPDKPFRIGSSFSFGYDLKNITPKHGEPEFEEKFPEPEDFKGSQLKSDLYRLIIGTIKRRVRPKSRLSSLLESRLASTCDPRECKEREEMNRTPKSRLSSLLESRLSSICDPRECKKRKEMNRTWFTYILDNIRHPRPESKDDETRKFFTKILSRPAKKRRQTCCNRNQEDDDGWFSYVLSSIKKVRKQKPTIQTDAEHFFTEMLSETENFKSCDCNGNRRRRRRRPIPYGQYRSMFNAPGKLVESDSDWFPKSRKREEEEKTPYRVRTECCCSYGYKNKGSRETDSESSHSESESMNYATT